MSRVSALSGLPEAVFALAPELDAIPLDPEPLTTCSRCARVAEHHGGDPSKPWAFDPKVRCCTFSPILPNVLVGGALRRGGAGAARLRARIGERRDMTPWGLYVSKAYDEAYTAALERFGRAPELKCPYWGEGDLGCGIWPDRPPVCRTWHCRHTRGEAGRQQWHHVRQLLDVVLDKLAVACVAAGRPPLPIDPPSDWEAWFVWCAGWVEGRGADLVDLLRDEAVEAYAAKVVDGAGSPRALPDVVIPCLTQWERDGSRMYLIGYSRFDGVYADPTVFELLSRLDGVVTWREALASANANLAVPLPESLVADLFRIHALRAPQDSDHPLTPGVPVPT